jgi:hypothetical protein
MNEKLIDLLKDGYTQQDMLECKPYNNGGWLKIKPDLLKKYLGKKFIVLVKGDSVIVVSDD